MTPGRNDADATIENLAAALTEALTWGWVEGRPGPTYRVPCAIDHDLWKWADVRGKRAAYRTIREAVRAVADRKPDPGPLLPSVRID